MYIKRRFLYQDSCGTQGSHFLSGNVVRSASRRVTKVEHLPHPPAPPAPVDLSSDEGRNFRCLTSVYGDSTGGMSLHNRHAFLHLSYYGAIHGSSTAYAGAPAPIPGSLQPATARADFTHY